MTQAEALELARLALADLIHRLEFVANQPRETNPEEIEEVCGKAVAFLRRAPAPSGWISVPRDQLQRWRSDLPTFGMLDTRFRYELDELLAKERP